MPNNKLIIGIPEAHLSNYIKKVFIKFYSFVFVVNIS